MNLIEFNKNYLTEYMEVLNSLEMEIVEDLYKKIDQARLNSNSIFVLGSGGSAASASHWVCDFNKGANYENSKRIKMFCLTDNTPTFSALGNDISYEDVFKEQLKNYLEKDDLVIGLSVSGNSENIVRALKYANSVGAETFSLVGDFPNSQMKEHSAKSLVIPSSNYGIVEDIHMYICHTLSQFLQKKNKELSKSYIL